MRKRNKITDKMRLDWLQKNTVEYGLSSGFMGINYRFDLQKTDSLRQAIDSELRKSGK